MKKRIFFLLAFFAKILYIIYCRTIKIRVVNPHLGRSFINDKSVVFACWHSKTFLLLPHIRGWSVVTLTLLDWKNFFYDKLCLLFGCRTVPVMHEVSATRRLLQYLNGGSSVILAVDGPKGPRGRIRPGAAFLAEKAKTPIIVFRVEMEKSFRIKSRWDHYEIPYPFSRATITLHEPFKEFDENQGKVENRLREYLGTY